MVQKLINWLLINALLIVRHVSIINDQQFFTRPARSTKNITHSRAFWELCALKLTGFLIVDSQVLNLEKYKNSIFPINLLNLLISNNKFSRVLTHKNVPRKQGNVDTYIHIWYRRNWEGNDSNGVDLRSLCTSPHSGTGHQLDCTGVLKVVMMNTKSEINYAPYFRLWSDGKYFILHCARNLGHFMNRI